MILLLSLAFSTVCVAASLRRLGLVAELTPLLHEELTAALGTNVTAERRNALASALAEDDHASWERAVVEASRLDLDARAALLGEASTELDHGARSWARVPRASASLASSFGFLLATLSLRAGLSGLGEAAGDSTMSAVNAAVLDALDAVAIGLAASACCVAVQTRAATLLRLRVANAVRFVDRLDESPPGGATAFAPQDDRATVATHGG